MSVYGETVITLARQGFPLSLRSQAILFALGDTPADFGAVVETLGLLDRKSAVTRHADALVSYGLIERMENPNDRRKVFLSLTKPGKAVVKSLLNGGKKMPALTVLP